MLKIYEQSLFQDKRIRALFPSSERPFNKEKKRKYENHLKKLGLIAYNEEFLNCNTNKNFSKIYRINNCSYKKSSPTTASFGKNHYVLIVPKSIHLIYFAMEHEPTINEYKTIYLKYLNQKVTFHIYNDDFYYYIETFLKLPNYSKSIKYWIKKQIDDYFLKLLREGKLVKKAYSDKILQNIEKIVKNRSYRHYFLKGYYSVLALLNESERESHFFGIRKLRFKKTEICFFHNVRLRINGNKMVILTRDTNRLLGDEFNDIGELFESFLDIGLHAIGIKRKDVTSLELVSLEVAKELNGFDKRNHRDIPVLKYGKKTRKRDLSYIGFENFYDYIDFSSIDDNGEPIPEYEIQYFNRKQKTIPDIIRELDVLFPFEPKKDNKVNFLQAFEITPSKPDETNLKNDFPLEYKNDYKFHDFNDLVKMILLRANWILSKT